MNKKKTTSTKKVVRKKVQEKKAVPKKKITKSIPDKKKRPSIQRFERGKVVGLNMNNTAVVEIERKKKHPVYKKYITISNRVKVHADIKELKVGEMVNIKQTRPISKEIRWVLIEKSKGRK